MIILVINCGSSSVKYDVFDVSQEVSLCKGIVERIGESSAYITHEPQGGKKDCREIECPDHLAAITIIKDIITSPVTGIISELSEVTGVGHRVVHGGEEFSESTLIDAEVIRSIEKFSELAPLHNPPSLEGIRGCMKIFTGVPQVAVFDTAFHQTMKKEAYCYGIPYRFYEKYGIRRYGFHGTSHLYVSRKASEVLGRSAKEVNLITVHLGNGCSIAAVAGGKSVDTSMGFTPLEGLLMGTRSGDLDPAVVTFLMQKESMAPGEVSRVLNKESGLLGISGISNDMRDILGAISKGDERAKLAYDIFVYRIKKYIGAYAAVLGRVDAVVFTGGIGENVTAIRDSIRKDLENLLGDETEFMSLRTNEELLIAQETYGIVKESMKNLRL